MTAWAQGCRSAHSLSPRVWEDNWTQGSPTKRRERPSTDMKRRHSVTQSLLRAQWEATSCRDASAKVSSRQAIQHARSGQSSSVRSPYDRFEALRCQGEETFRFLSKRQQPFGQKCGAGEGNRTLVISLKVPCGCCDFNARSDKLATIGGLEPQRLIRAVRTPVNMRLLE